MKKEIVRVLVEEALKLDGMTPPCRVLLPISLFMFVSMSLEGKTRPDKDKLKEIFLEVLDEMEVAYQSDTKSFQKFFGKKRETFVPSRAIMAGAREMEYRHQAVLGNDY